MPFDIERPDSDYPGYHDAMEWESWPDDWEFQIEEDEY